MKAIPIIYEGIQFRSKLEARWYIFMKKLGWNVVYEPEIEGINGWIPDFLIIGECHKTLVDVKGIDRVTDQIGFMDHEGSWCCRVTGEGGKTYIFRPDPHYNEHCSTYEKIDTHWNEAGTKLRWKGK